MPPIKILALRTSATLALLSAFSLSAQAQVSVTADTSEQIRTSTAAADGSADDVTVEQGATVTIDSAGASGLVVDSDNALVLNGVVRSDDLDNVTGVELNGDNSGANTSYTQSGSIQLVEDFEAQDTDDDPFSDTPFAVGEGRTGILISGASPFQGNIELDETSLVVVEGNDSYGINLASTPLMTEGLTGNLSTNGQINIIGDRSVGVNLASNITGNVTNAGTVSALGENSVAYAIAGDITGGFNSSGALRSTGFRDNGQRRGFGADFSDAGREDLTAEDLLQGGSTLSISGNISEGIFLSEVFLQSVDADGNPNLDADGNEIFFLTGQESTISQFGSAPAVLIDGGGTVIDIGLVAAITNPNNGGETGQYGFINQGSVSASGVYNDFDATTISVANVTFAGGISNEGTLAASTFRSPAPTTLTDGSGIARVLVLGDQTIADEINNSGIILASASEAADEVFFDRENIIAPRSLTAIAVDIGSGASVTDLINTGSISALLIGRDGTAVAIRDASGTVRSLNTTGSIVASGRNSDPLDQEDTNFDLIAIDFSAATQSVEITQSQNPDSTGTPLLVGDILLGSGNDSFTASAGLVTGDLDFGGGNDTLTLSGENTIFAGTVTNTDLLDLSVTDGANLTLTADEDITVSQATFDGTTVYRPTINGATGEATTLVSAGDITFEEGASINPLLESIIGTDTLQYTLASAGNLTIGDLSSLGTGESPFLFSTALSLSDPNTLVVTLDLRDPNVSVANGGLGLDAVQAAAFGTLVNGQFENGPVLDALRAVPTLGNAFSNITEASDFYAAYNQVLPEFSGASKQFLLANVDGAVGSVGSHLDTARRSPEKSGGAWLQEFFYFADRELAGLSEQYRGEGFGFSAGLDTAVGPFHAVGVNVGFASTEVEDVVGIDDPLNVRTYQAGAYAGLQSGNFNFDVYAGGGISELDQERRVTVGNFTGTASGESEAAHANAAFRAGYEFALSDRFWARPSLSVDYLYLNEYGYTETGDEGVRLRVDGRRSETAAASLKFDVGAAFQGKRTWIRPSVRVGYRNEFISDPTETTFRFQGLTNSNGDLFDSELATLRAFAFPDESILLGFTVAAGSEYSSIGFDFDSDIRDGFIRHTGRIVVRLLF